VDSDIASTPYVMRVRDCRYHFLIRACRLVRAPAGGSAASVGILMTDDDTLFFAIIREHTIAGADVPVCHAAGHERQRAAARLL
jgi:hypothetical protein